MPTEIHFSPTALAYAQALLELANESKNATELGQELKDIDQIIQASPQFGQVLGDPSIGHEERDRLIRTAFEGRINKLLLDFILLVNRKGRLKILSSIIGAYGDLLKKQTGTVEVNVTVAQQISDEQLESVRQKVSAALKRDAVVHQSVDASIIGGVILQVQDKLIDGSVRTQLETFRRKLLAARPA